MYLFIPKKLYKKIPELKGKSLPKDNEIVHDTLIKYLDTDDLDLYETIMKTIGKIEYYVLASKFYEE